ncbi:MAG: hypothetical protein KDA66_17880 [Planctomycetaceae bacterium]|nr:hypothetical protein [Planctomycetaceae bacterium]MCB9953490.1 hypothetical protein [Planctomycetaceae bacterium]
MAKQPESQHPTSTSQEKALEVYELLAKDHPTEEEFRVLLKHVSPGVLAKRYLSTGLPFVFKDQPHKFLAFREALAKIFSVRPQDIAVMGSARFGFSTNPGKQSEAGAKQLDHSSDMDLVIVSKTFVDQSLSSFAEYVFSVLRNEESLKSDAKKPTDTVQLNKEHMLAARRRAKGFSFGYVNPSDLEDGTAEKQLFYDMKREAGTQLFGTAPPGPINRIGAWVYKDWDSAERMYEFSFRQLARAWKILSPDDTEEPGEINLDD